MSLFTKTLAGLAAADAILLMGITFGYVFPSHMAVPDPTRALPADSYDYSAKISPFDVQRSEPVRAVSLRAPKITARALPLVSENASVQNSGSAERKSAL